MDDIIGLYKYILSVIYSIAPNNFDEIIWTAILLP